MPAFVLLIVHALHFGSNLRRLVHGHRSFPRRVTALTLSRARKHDRRRRCRRLFSSEFRVRRRAARRALWRSAGQDPRLRASGSGRRRPGRTGVIAILISSAVMPTPLSRMRTTTPLLLVRSASTETMPPSGVNLTAFEMMFVNICLSFCGVAAYRRQIVGDRRFAFSGALRSPSDETT